MKITRLLTFALALLATAVPSAQASETYLDYFFKDPGDLNAGARRHFNRVLSDLDNRQYVDADASMVKVLDNLKDNLAPETQARLLANAGLLKALVNDQVEGLMLLDRSIQIIEANSGPFDIGLLDLLVAQGKINFAIESFESAEDAFRRAQHIAHRNDGVYTRKQLPIIDELRDIQITRGLLVEADREARFTLKISEQVYGDNSEALVPVLERLGGYFAARGDMLPCPNLMVMGTDGAAASEQYRSMLFRESVDLFERAIAILEDHYGPDDLRLVEPLRGLAEARVLQCTSGKYAEKAMERALELVANHPATDVADHARALVSLGDVYTITSDGRAADRYVEAWHLLSDDPELDELKQELFGAPTRIFPDAKILTLSRTPLATAEGEHLYADLEYTVSENGRVSLVKVVDGNVPNENKNSIRSYLKRTKFRPRLVDGSPVPTPGLLYHQTFKVIEPTPTFSVKTDVGPPKPPTYY